ncbi:putative neck protein, type 1 [Halobacterium phage ChaoS9]|uniref:Neck protein, type 1 n=1 Tax=Halobacterium phage ChaoS9 TaxID=2847105 RepID=A0A481V6T5_9CAUD|nr:tail completion or Neck1 protein [Halobacterium phage ChaoS9]QBI90021.1 putative neck protein, type 1 [Halobacterium phage ChaoS9]
MVDDENNFDEVAEALDDGLAAGLVELHSDTLGTLDQNMKSGQDALGRDWEPIKPETLQSRKVRTSDPAPLVDTSNLRGDIQSTSTVDLNRLIGIIGTTLAYGAVHELGAPEAGIPRRPIFAPAATYAERRAVDVIGKEIDTRLEGAGL